MGRDRNYYPNLIGKNARSKMKRDEINRQRADAAFDARESARLSSSEKADLRRSVSTAEKCRVEALIARDKAERTAEQIRELAEIKVRDGVTASLVDTVVPPTPEWEKQGDVESYLPRQPEGTVAVISTKRRPPCAQARKMMLSGVIDHDGYKTCCWYAELTEQAGLAGSIPSTDYTREVFSPPNARSPFTDYQIEWQDTLKVIRSQIGKRHLRMLDRMVLEDVPVHRAARAARAFHRDPKKGFAEAVDQLCQARSNIGWG